MRYLGGKSKIAKYIVELISSQRGKRTKYVEPFLGGGTVFERAAPLFDISYGSDICEDLILMWQAARDGWVPPVELTLSEWSRLKTAVHSPLRGFAGFGCSFGGVWFGSYAKGGNRNYAAESSRAVTRIASKMQGSEILCQPYWDWDAKVDSDTVVYCDPPYAGTSGYKAAGNFDHARFWSVMESWSRRGAAVLVSEYSAPDPWMSTWSMEHKQYLGKKQTRDTMLDQVFMLPGT